MSALALLAVLIATAQHGAVPQAWTYTGPTGPEHWAELDPAFAACAAGTAQSPIDFESTAMADAATRVRTSYSGGLATVVREHSTVTFRADAGNVVSIGGDRFDLMQMHLHVPSEHTIDGMAMPLEAHFVHRGEAGELAVLGLLFREGDADARFASLWSAIPDGGASAIPDLPLADLWDLATFAFLTYDGSLTTPPCSESVRWFVSDTGLTVSSEQIHQFLAAFGPNARPVQPRHGRSVGR